MHQCILNEAIQQLLSLTDNCNVGIYDYPPSHRTKEDQKKVSQDMLSKRKK